MCARAVRRGTDLDAGMCGAALLVEVDLGGMCARAVRRGMCGRAVSRGTDLGQGCAPALLDEVLI